MSGRRLLLALGIACFSGTLLGSPPAAGAGAAHDRAVIIGSERDRARAARKQLARSIWGVVPDAPERKRDLRPELIRGSAVAVSDTTLLTSCGALGGSQRIGLVRHRKFRIARLIAADPGRDVCTLAMAGAPLNPARGYREAADLARGEPVYALTNRTAADLALVEGEVTGAFGAGPGLETSLVLPAGTISAVVLDRSGTLVGLGAPAPGGRTVVAPITATLAPEVPSRGRGHEPDEAGHAGGALPVTLTSAHGPRPVLRPGEPVQARLLAGADAYAYCFYEDGEGRVSRIFPNRFQPDALVRAGRGIAIPGSRAGFRIVPERSGTVEAIGCFVAERDPGPALPPALVSADLAPLPVGSLREVADAFRGLGREVAEVGLPIRVAGEQDVTAALYRRSRP